MGSSSGPPAICADDGVSCTRGDGSAGECHAGVCEPLCPAVFGADMGITGPSFYRLATGQLDSTAANEIVAGAYDGSVCAFSSAGENLWAARTGGLTFDVDVGPGGVAVASADGDLYLLEPTTGAIRWQHTFHAPLYQARFVTVGTTTVLLAGGVSRDLVMFNVDTGAVLDTYSALTGTVIRVRVGNVDADPEPEALVLTKRTDGGDYSVVVLDLDPEGAAPLDALVPPGRQTLDTGIWDIQLADVDVPPDGIAELVTDQGIFRFNPGLTPSALPATPYVVFTNNLGPATYDFSPAYRMGMVAVGNFTDAAGVEIAVLSGPDLSLYDQAGAPVGGPSLASARAPQGFTHLAALAPQRTGANTTPLILGSSPNDDNQLYKVNFSTGAWQTPYRNTPRAGRVASMVATNTAFTTALKALPTTSSTPLLGQAGPFVVTMDHTVINRVATLNDLVDRAIADAAPYRDAAQFAGTNIKFATVILPMEADIPARPDGNPWDQDHRYVPYQLSTAHIMSAVARMAAANMPFYMQVGHGCDPYVSASTALAACNSVPDHCLGFVTAEDEASNTSVVDYYMLHHVLPILEGITAMVRTPGQPKPQFIFREKGVWWATYATRPGASATLFPAGNPYRSVIVPSAEDSNTRTPDIDLAARVGLWRDGLVDRWACRMTADDFSFNRLWEWEYPMAGHPHLRYFAAQAALGASVFMVFVGQGLPDAPTRVGAEGILPFLHLLGRGVLEPPTVQQFVSAVPVALRVTHPVSARFEKGGAGGHNFFSYAPVDLDPGAFTRVETYWGMAPTAPDDLSGPLWGRTVQSGNFIPAGPGGGYVTLLPQPINTPSRWTRVWQTDGTDVKDPDGVPVSLAQARAGLLNDVNQALEALPFGVTGPAFSTMARISADRVVLYLVDPGYLRPRERRVHITAREPSTPPWRVVDRVTGADLGPLGSGMDVLVPQGLLRVIELVR